MAFYTRFKSCFLLVALALPVCSQAAELIDVRYSTAVGDQLKLEFVFDSNISEPTTSIIGEPAQLAFNFMDATSKLELNKLPINGSGVRHVIVNSSGASLNVAIMLDKLVEFKPQLIANKYVIFIGEQANKVAAVSSATREEVVTSKPVSLNQIDAIGFRLSQQNDGQLKVGFKNSSIAASVEQNGRQIIIKLLGATITEEHLYTMDVVDFATPVRSFETFQDANGSRIVVDMMSDFTFEHEQLANEFVLTVKKPIIKHKSGPKKSKVVFNGKKMSLNFQKVEIRTALQIIADYNNFNLVTGDNVSGNITLRLEDVPWDQALDMILKLKGLDKRIEGNILLVAPVEELLTREAAALKASQVVEELVPLYSEYIQINYAKAKDIAVLLDGGTSKLLSERGTVSVDERTNMLLVQDTATKLDEVRSLVEVLDIPVRQVVIEARLVTVTDNVNEEFGIRWGVTNTISDGAFSGNLKGANSASGGIVPNLSDRLNVNLPVTEPAGTIAFQVAKLGSGTLLDLELTALERENKGEVIARPSITTANQQPAYIEQGTEIPYVSASSSGATTVSFKKAVLALRVTPHITPDNRIILDLVISQDTRGDTVKTPLGEAVSINTQEIGTQVLVDNGQTIVLGGIYQQQLIKTVSKVPVLGDVPLLGWLFRTQKTLTERRELLIFVTPRIITDKRHNR